MLIKIQIIQKLYIQKSYIKEEEKQKIKLFRGKIKLI